MFSKFTMPLVVALALWVAYVAVHIEIQNAKADYYLPRHGIEADVTWRVSSRKIFEHVGMEWTPAYEENSKLYNLVSTQGLLQYLLAPPLFLLALVCVAKRGTGRPVRWLAVVCGVIGIAALGLAVYRGYFTSFRD